MVARRKNRTRDEWMGYVDRYIDRVRKTWRTAPLLRVYGESRIRGKQTFSAYRATLSKMQVEAFDGRALPRNMNPLLRERLNAECDAFREEVERRGGEFDSVLRPLIGVMRHAPNTFRLAEKLASDDDAAQHDAVRAFDEQLLPEIQRDRARYNCDTCGVEASVIRSGLVRDRMLSTRFQEYRWGGAESPLLRLPLYEDRTLRQMLLDRFFTNERIRQMPVPEWVLPSTADRDFLANMYPPETGAHGLLHTMMETMRRRGGADSYQLVTMYVYMFSAPGPLLYLLNNPDRCYVLPWTCLCNKSAHCDVSVAWRPPLKRGAMDALVNAVYRHVTHASNSLTLENLDRLYTHDDNYKKWLHFALTRVLGSNEAKTLMSRRSGATTALFDASNGEHVRLRKALRKRVREEMVEAGLLVDLDAVNEKRTVDNAEAQTETQARQPEQIPAQSEAAERTATETRTDGLDRAEARSPYRLFASAGQLPSITASTPAMDLELEQRIFEHVAARTTEPEWRSQLVRTNILCARHMHRFRQGLRFRGRLFGETFRSRRVACSLFRTVEQAAREAEERTAHELEWLNLRRMHRHVIAAFRTTKDLAEFRQLFCSQKPTGTVKTPTEAAYRRVTDQHDAGLSAEELRQAVPSLLHQHRVSQPVDPNLYAFDRHPKPPSDDYEQLDTKPYHPWPIPPELRQRPLFNFIPADTTTYFYPIHTTVVRRLRSAAHLLKAVAYVSRPSKARLDVGGKSEEDDRKSRWSPTTDESVRQLRERLYGPHSITDRTTTEPQLWRRYVSTLIHWDTKCWESGHFYISVPMLEHCPFTMELFHPYAHANTLERYTDHCLRTNVVRTHRRNAAKRLAIHANFSASSSITGEELAAMERRCDEKAATLEGEAKRLWNTLRRAEDEAFLCSPEPLPLPSTPTGQTSNRTAAWTEAHHQAWRALLREQRAELSVARQRYALFRRLVRFHGYTRSQLLHLGLLPRLHSERSRHRPMLNADCTMFHVRRHGYDSRLSIEQQRELYAAGRPFTRAWFNETAFTRIDWWHSERGQAPTAEEDDCVNSGPLMIYDSLMNLVTAAKPRSSSATPRGSQLDAQLAHEVDGDVDSLVL